MITFDPLTHVYTDAHGARVPNVTAILGAVPPWLGRFDHIPPDVLAYKQWLGACVHHATALADLGTLDTDDLDPDRGAALGLRRRKARGVARRGDGVILTLDVATHTYRFPSGRPYPGPSVTTVLSGSQPDVNGVRAWPGVPPWSNIHIPPPGMSAEAWRVTLDYKRALGSAVHHATALDDLGVLDESSLDDAVGIRLEGARAYRRDTGAEPFRFVDAEGHERTAIECIVAHDLCGVCGTLDRIWRLRDGSYRLDDYKTSDPARGPEAGPQTAAYLESFRRLFPGVLPARVARASIHLTDDGRYRIVEHPDRNDWRVFCAALELWNFSRRTCV